MNKKKRISKCLEELRNAHCDWWAGIAKRNGVDLEDLQQSGYIKEKEEKTTSRSPIYEITNIGYEFIAKNRAYLRPTLDEYVHHKVATVKYRGKKIWVFDDEPGQQYYFYWKGECVGCGSFNPLYEDFIKDFLDTKLDFICHVDTPEYPFMRASLEYRRGADGKIAKYLILSDRDLRMLKEPFYVGERFSDNEACIAKARYLISIFKFHQDKEEGKQTEDKR